MTKTTICLLVFFSFLSIPIFAKNFSPEKMGFKIALEADRRNNGYGDSRADLDMILRNKHGHTTTRTMRNRTIEQEKDGDKALIVFENPQDVKGTAFLSFTHKIGNDDQWLYLPALKRVKRIASSNRSGPFMGSEFAYEDISSQEIEKYSYKYLGDEVNDNIEFFVLERTPTDPKSGYSKQIVWLDKNEYRIKKVEYYDRKSEKLKTLLFEDYQKYLNKYWRANSWLMVNHITGKSTEMRFSNWRFNNGYSSRDFTKSSLTRIR